MISSYVDLNSYNYCTNEANQVVVYGWSHCLYHFVISALEQGRVGLKKKNIVELTDRDIRAFDHSIGYPKIKKGRKCLETLDGRLIEQIAIMPELYEETHAHLCKAGIANLLLENLKRVYLELPLIPLLFVIDVNKNKHPSSAKTILSRKEHLNDLVTHKELRRCYRLIQLAKELDSPKLLEVCEKTFRFIKLEDKKGRFVMKLKAAPWQSKSWDRKWKKRMKTKPVREISKPDDVRWQNYFIHFNPEAI